MERIENHLLRLLHNLTSGNEFVASGNKEFVLPGLQVKKFGEVALPITEHQAR